MATKRTIDLLTDSYSDQMSNRRKFEFKNSNGEKILDLYFKPLTREDRIRAQQTATDDPTGLKITSQLLCEKAELEDGSKAFHKADAPNLQRELPEKVLNDLELFMFDIKLNVDQAKNELSEITG